MKNQKVLDSVLEFIENNPGSSVEAITVGTKSSDILVRSAIKTLQAEGAITSDQDTGSYSFNSGEKAAPEQAETTAPALKEKKAESKTTKKKEEDLGPKTFTGRNNDKYKFGEHRNLPKGRLVLALVKAYVESNKKVGLTKLQELFHSEEIQPRYGIIVELNAAKKFSKNNVDRFFVKNAEDIIKLADGKRVAVCNQWSAENLNKLLKVVAANPIGLRVSVEKVAE